MHLENGEEFSVRDIGCNTEKIICFDKGNNIERY